jgi:hypothetical protein
MERRRGKRITVSLKAERLSCTKNCSVFIENLSEDGIHIVTAPAKNPYIFEPGVEVELKLETNNGETINLQCNVKWSYDNSPEDLTNSVGLEIIDPPQKYIEFINTLN